MKIKYFRPCVFIVLIAMLLVPLGSSRNAVLAQGETWLSIQPANSNLAEGGTTTVKVEVSNGSNLNAYDVTIIYNNEVITLASWSHGAYFTNLAVLINENQPGRLHLVATQLATPGKSGDGTMLNLVFEGAAPGESTVSIQNVQMSTSSSESVFPGVSDGRILVQPQATFTFTPSLTPTKTFTPTITRTPTSTQTPTRTLTPTPSRTPTITATSVFAFTSTSTVAGAQTMPSEATQTIPARTATIPPSSGQSPAPQTSPSKAGLIYPRGTPVAAEIAASVTPESANSTTEQEMRNQARLNTLLWGLTIFLILILAGIIIYHAMHRNKV